MYIRVPKRMSHSCDENLSKPLAIQWMLQTTVPDHSYHKLQRLGSRDRFVSRFKFKIIRVWKCYSKF